MNILTDTVLNIHEAIAMCGLEVVEKLEKVNCDPTTRLMESHEENLIEFSASVKFTDNDDNDWNLFAYYYQEKEDVENCEALSSLDWKIDHFKII